MRDFQPYPGMSLTLGQATYTFTPHPLLPPEMEEVFVIEGGEALIYQLQEVSSGELLALKILKDSFRGPLVAYSLATLLPLARHPGFYVANRLMLTAANYPETIQRFPALEGAILMPWISGMAWASIISVPSMRATYTRAHARTLAVRMGRILATWEAAQLAHTDISGGNIIIGPDFRSIECIDCERIFGPGAPIPQRLNGGSPGYQHPLLKDRGQWCAEGDRFAGAVLLTEMLTCWAAPVQALIPAGADTLFQPREMHIIETPQWHAIRDALWSLCPDALVLFDLAWTSRDLADCPPLASWAEALAALR